MKGERVYRNGKSLERLSYYTNDRDDALGTFKAMVEHESRSYSRHGDVSPSI